MADNSFSRNTRPEEEDLETPPPDPGEDVYPGNLNEYGEERNGVPQGNNPDLARDGRQENGGGSRRRRNHHRYHGQLITRNRGLLLWQLPQMLPYYMLPAANYMMPLVAPSLPPQDGVFNLSYVYESGAEDSNPVRPQNLQQVHHDALPAMAVPLQNNQHFFQVPQMMNPLVHTSAPVYLVPDPSQLLVFPAYQQVQQVLPIMPAAVGFQQFVPVAPNPELPSVFDESDVPYEHRSAVGNFDQIMNIPAMPANSAHVEASNDGGNVNNPKIKNSLHLQASSDGDDANIMSVPENIANLEGINDGGNLDSLTIPDNLAHLQAINDGGHVNNLAIPEISAHLEANNDGGIVSNLTIPENSVHLEETNEGSSVRNPAMPNNVAVIKDDGDENCCSNVKCSICGGKM